MGGDILKITMIVEVKNQCDENIQGIGSMYIVAPVQTLRELDSYHLKQHFDTLIHQAWRDYYTSLSDQERKEGGEDVDN